MMTSRQRISLALLWLLLLLVAGWWISGRLTVSGDLRSFMPSAKTSAQRFLIDELGEGPGARLLLIGLRGDSTQALAEQSQAMAGMLRENSVFTVVSNGDQAELEVIDDALLPYRYLLSSTLDTQRLDQAYLQGEINQRMQDLGSPAAALVEPLLANDPTLETLAVIERWQPENSPQRIFDVWFDPAGKTALMLVQTRAAGFDPRAQRAAYDAIQAAFTKTRRGQSVLWLTGPGAFSVEISERTEREASLIGTVDSLGLIILLLIAYRSWRTPLFGILPLASAGLAGLAAVALSFEIVHGITIAFGFTLIGVVQDYPIHLFSHQHAGISPWKNVRNIWPALATGVASTCIAYLTFFFSGVDGLQQLAVFTITALAVAALCTRFLLPALIDPQPRDAAQSQRLETLMRVIAKLPRPRWSLLVLTLIAVASIASVPGPFWQNDLAKLTPVSPELLLRDNFLRNAVGAPDVRYLITITADNEDQALIQLEGITPLLDTLIDQGIISNYDHAAKYLPSSVTQQRRQQQLPGTAELNQTLAAVLDSSPFRSDAFAPFIYDVASAKKLSTLTIDQLSDTLLADRINALLRRHNKKITALITLSGVSQPQRIEQAVQAHKAQWIDLKKTSESLVVMYRERILSALAIAAVLLVLTVAISLRNFGRTLRVLLPMVLTTLIIIALLRLFQIELTLFHLVSLVLAAGLGLDYALFFDHAGDAPADQRRTLHAIIVCSLMTLLVFFLLALSTIPVLRAIGTTVAIGVISNFLLGLLVSRRTPLAQ